MTAATDRITRPGPNGPVTLTARVWQLLEDAYRAVGLDPDRQMQISQGSWSSSVAASGSTHSAGATFDVRTSVIPAEARVPLVLELRRRGVAAWMRGPAWGQPSMGEHAHGVARGEYGSAAPSSSAQGQIAAYDAGRDGLSSNGPDYHARPPWKLYTYQPEDTMPTPAEIADAVWSSKTTDPVNGETVSMRELARRTRTVATQARDAARAADKQTRPPGTRAAVLEEAPEVPYPDLRAEVVPDPLDPALETDEE